MLTFINNLVKDLEEKLGSIAEVKTFHRFCRRMLHTLVPRGLSLRFDYYPPLTEILATDTSAILAGKVTKWDVEAVLHTRDSENDILVTAVQCGDYYDAVGHTDGVYRMVRYFDEHPEDIPVYAQIVVDEYQDFSALEVRLIEQLAEGSPALVVGDDDQALYGFKHASPEHLRRLATEGKYTRFELPYCTRCPAVLVDAVGDVVFHAQALGLLEGRVPKRFECYMPDKREDSERYPTIIHARCTRHDRRAPYMAMYIEQQIRMIPEEDVREARKKDHPAVLVTGPAQFVGEIYNYLADRFPQVEYKRSEPSHLNLIDGYLRLLRDDRSRLGWRIVTFTSQTDELNGIIRQAIGEKQELADLLPEAYREEHLAAVELIRKVREQDSLSEDEVRRLEEALSLALPDLQRRVGAETAEEGVEEAFPAEAAEAGDAGPSSEVEEESTDEVDIVVTNLVGAKGLQASHVFLAGVNEQHFPRSNDDPTDTEVCELIVALTRATKRSYLLSCQRFGGQPVRESLFLGWLAPRLQTVSVSAAYFRP